MNGSKPPEELDLVMLDNAHSASDDTTLLYEDVATEIAEIPGLLSPASPPPYAKDRVMARVRKDSVNFYIAKPEDGGQSLGT